MGASRTPGSTPAGRPLSALNSGLGPAARAATLVMRGAVACETYCAPTAALDRGPPAALPTNPSHLVPTVCSTWNACNYGGRSLGAGRFALGRLHVDCPA